jgi:hypothetical protein
MDFLKKHFQDWQKTIAPLQIARKKLYTFLLFPLLMGLIFLPLILGMDNNTYIDTILAWVYIFFHLMTYLITILLTSQNISLNIIGINTCIFSFFIIKPLIYLHFIINKIALTPEQSLACLYNTLVSVSIVLFLITLIIFRKIFLILGQ